MSKKKQREPVPDPASFGLPLTGVESHAHLDNPRYAGDLEATLERAEKAGIARIGQVFLSTEAWEKGRGTFAAHPGVFFILGIHPTEAALLTLQERADIRKAALADPRIRAVGEIGLDYYWKDCPPEIQKDAFAGQLALAREVDLPVVIHSREARRDTVDMLVSEGFKDYPVLWHCFGDGREEAREILDLGWHISIPGPVTFPANQALREAVSYIPAERMLMETDCPYLAPMPLRGRRNEPAYLAFTIQAMAQAKGLDPAELWTVCGENAARFFNLAPLPV